MSAADHPVQTQITQFADEACRMLAPRAGDRMDFSPASLSLVDALLSEMAALAAELPEDTLEALAQRLGCYALEVAQRACGGQYYWHDEAEQPMLVAGPAHAPVGLMTWGRVAARLAGDADETLQPLQQAFSERLSAAAALPATDPSTGDPVPVADLALLA